MTKPRWKYCGCGFRTRLPEVIAYHKSVAPKACYSKARAKREKKYREAEAAEFRALFAADPATPDDFDDVS